MPGVGEVLRFAGTVRALAVAFTAQEDGTAGRLQAQDVDAYPGLAEPGTAVAPSDPAEAAVFLF